MKSFTFLLAITIGIALNAKPVHSVYAEPKKFHPILPASKSNFSLFSPSN